MKILLRDDTIVHERSHVKYIKHSIEGDKVVVSYKATKASTSGIWSVELSLPAVVEISRGKTTTEWHYTRNDTRTRRKRNGHEYGDQEGLEDEEV